MKYRSLGNTGIKVSEIGFGAWGIGGDSYGTVYDDISVKALYKAYELGITFYDTADTYGSGHSEELIGKVFRGKRDKVIIATKGGTLPHFNLPMPQDFSPKHLREALEQSLIRLRTDYVDLYQLHSPPLDDVTYTVIRTLSMFKNEGKIRAYGVSVRSPKDGLNSKIYFEVDTIQCNFNMIDQRALRNGLINTANEVKGFIARTPLCFGFLSGVIPSDIKFESNDHRINWPKKQIERWANAPELFRFLKESNKGQSYAQLALRYCLSYPISTTIPGMLTPEEVEENVKASDFGELSKEDLAGIRKVYNSNSFYVGRG